MTRIKKLVVLLGVTGSTVAGFSCTNRVLQESRDAALAAFANFVETQSFDYLDNAVNGTE